MIGKIMPIAGTAVKLMEEGGSEVTPSALNTLLGNITDIFTEMMDWVGTLMTTITSNPLLLLLIVGAFSLIAIGIVRRLLRL